MQKIDDTDGRIEYGGSWIKGGVDREHNHTTHGVNGTGCTATLQFNGTAVFVYGTIAAGVGKFVSNYTLDDGREISNPSTRAGQTQYNQSFYNSTGLKDMPHTLMIRADPHFWLDYFQIMPSNSSIVTEPSSKTTVASYPNLPQPSSTSTLSTGPTTLSLPLTTQPSPPSPVVTSKFGTHVQTSTPHSISPILSTTPSSSLLTKHTSDTRPIIGGVIGGAVVALIVALLVWRHSQKRRHQRKKTAVAGSPRAPALFHDDARSLDSWDSRSATTILSRLSAAAGFDPSRMVRTPDKHFGGPTDTL